MLTLPNGVRIDTKDFDAFGDLILNPVTKLDASGEHCRFDSDQDSQIEIQAYGTGWNGEPVMVESCGACMAKALDNSGADFAQPITLEYVR